MPAHLSALVQIDALRTRFLDNKDFINAAKGPDNAAALHSAVLTLVENWPTVEQIQALESHIMGLNGAMRGDDRIVLNKLKAVRNLKFIGSYSSAIDSSEQDIKLFLELETQRPQDRGLYDRFKDSEDFGPVVSAIFNITKRN